MAFRTLPNDFSITALLADQVELLARHERLSPGAAALLRGQLMDSREGRQHLLRILKTELRGEPSPVEAMRIAEVLAQTRSWVADMDRQAGDDDGIDIPREGCGEQSPPNAPAYRAIPRPLKSPLGDASRGRVGSPTFSRFSRNAARGR